MNKLILILLVTLIVENRDWNMNALNAERSTFLELVDSETEQIPFYVLETGIGVGVPEKVREEAREILSDHFEDDQYRFTLSLRWMPGSLVQKNENDIVSVELAGEINRYTNFEVLYREGNRIEKAEVQLTLDLEKKVPVAAKRVMYGETLNNENIHYNWVSIANESESLVDSKNRLIGKTLRRTLAAGQPIRYADIASEFVIFAGDEVKLLFEENGILISITAQARQDGEIDELITIYSNKTRTRYLGRVLSQGVAKWEKTL